VVGKIRKPGDAGVQPSQPVAPVSRDFVTRLLPGSAAGPGPGGGDPFGVIQGGADRLLTVREAAEQLGLCTATVYGLCADGALPHLRILNAIRIAPGDLRAFIAARRT
jgi:excisionase family DNA binding protein